MNGRILFQALDLVDLLEYVNICPMPSADSSVAVFMMLPTGAHA